MPDLHKQSKCSRANIFVGLTGFFGEGRELWFCQGWHISPILLNALSSNSFLKSFFPGEIDFKNLHGTSMYIHFSRLFFCWVSQLNN